MLLRGWDVMIRQAFRILRDEGVIALARYTIIKIDSATGIPSMLLAPYAQHKFKNIKNVAEAIDFLFSNSLLASIIRPMQIREEIESLAHLIAEQQPKVILEIGTARGGTLFIWTRAASSDAIIISIDLPRGLFGGGYPRPKALLYKNFAREKQQLILLRADSHSKATLEKIKKILNKRPVDFLFIDGDHRYEGVKKDYEMYSPLVKPGGIIAFHDIVPGPEKLVGGVPLFWRRLKESLSYNKYKEIVKDWSQGGYGIGIIFK